MRKFLILFVVISSIVMTSCGSGSTTTEVTDSTSVVVDTTNVPVNSGGGNTDGKEVKPSELPLK